MGFWKDEWNQLNENEKKKFINTFKPTIYILIAIIGVLIAIGNIATFLK